MGKIDLKFIKDILKMEIELFEDDFNGDYDEKARLLHKHYTKILRLLEYVK